MGIIVARAHAKILKMSKNSGCFRYLSKIEWGYLGSHGVFGKAYKFQLCFLASIKGSSRKGTQKGKGELMFGGYI